MASAGKAGPVLPWMRVPISIEVGSGVPIGRVQGLDSRLAAELEKGSGFSELFPVQAAVWQHCGGGLSTAHDLCVAAPTGSGKTLAYALPVLNALASVSHGGACVGRLRALVVLPTRDLAAQVYDVFRPLCEAVQLRVALAAARSSEAAEAAQLVGTAAAAGANEELRRGPGGADVVVATPGRLMAHLSGTPGFTLKHLRFLVVDETDRLLRQSYQEWLPGVLERLAPSAPVGRPCSEAAAAAAAGAVPMGPWAADWRGEAGGGGDGERHFAVLWPTATRGSLLPYSRPRPVKIVVSATLTRDPAKLQRLALCNPRYVATVASATGAGSNITGDAAAAAARYSLPRSLSEFRLLCSAARKPLVLLTLLREATGQSTIVFTSSLDMTHKLFLMLRAVPELSGEVVEYSSLVPARERTAALERFRTGAAKVLVASDAMTRGMDIDGVHNVINYDAPVYAKTYVHRAGRTARAGRPGRVITLLRDEDMRHFKAMIRKADNNFVRELKLPPERVDAFKPALAGALQQVEELLAAERRADQQQLLQRKAAAAGAPATKPHQGTGQAAEPEAAATGAAIGARSAEGPAMKQPQKDGRHGAEAKAKGESGPTAVRLVQAGRQAANDAGTVAASGPPAAGRSDDVGPKLRRHVEEEGGKEEQERQQEGAVTASQRGEELREGTGCGSGAEGEGKAGRGRKRRKVEDGGTEGQAEPGRADGKGRRRRGGYR